jgi:hypothetical protein
MFWDSRLLWRWILSLYSLGVGHCVLWWVSTKGSGESAASTILLMGVLKRKWWEVRGINFMLMLLSSLWEFLYSGLMKNTIIKVKGQNSQHHKRNVSRINYKTKTDKSDMCVIRTTNWFHITGSKQQYSEISAVSLTKK